MNFLNLLESLRNLNCGYSITAITSPCQGEDRGSTLLTRSKKAHLKIKREFFVL